MPGLPDHQHLQELAQTHVHQVANAIKPLLSPFHPALKSFTASGSFPMSQLFTSGGQRIVASDSASFLQVNIQD